MELVEAELGVGFQYFSERYVSKVTLEPFRGVTAEASGTILFSHLVNVWKFENGPDPGSTWLDFSVEFQFRSHLYSAASQLFFEQVVMNMVSAFEKRCCETRNNSQWKNFGQRAMIKQDSLKNTAPHPSSKGTCPPPLGPGLWEGKDL